MRSESWKFIWQPNVSIRYFFDIAVTAGRDSRDSAAAGRAGTFAFAFRLLFPFRLAAGDEFTRAGADAVGDRRAADHAGNLIDASLVVQPVDGGDCPVAAYMLLDAELRRGTGGDLRQVRDAEHLEIVAQPPQLRPDHVRHSPADTGVHFVEDQG